MSEPIFTMLKNIKAEKNSIVDKFMTLYDFSSSALTSQALLQLKNNYCNSNKCIECAIGNRIIAS